MRIVSVTATVMSLCLGCRTPPDTPTSSKQRDAVQSDTTFYQEASWTPDGTKLVLSRLDIHDGYRASIVIVNKDGSGYTQLTNGPGDMWTSVSPDGERIAYASQQGDNRDIYLMNLDGSRRVRLTDHPAEDTHPTWSPDGGQITFVSKRDGVSQVYVMNADGSGQERVTRTSEEKWNPRWSPDGQRITYYGAREPGKDSVYVMHADGTNRSVLTNGIWPSWSSDGAKVLFVRDKDVYELSANGLNEKQVLEDAVIARTSPDGGTIAFVRVTWTAAEGWPAKSDVFTVRLDGSDLRNITAR